MELRSIEAIVQALNDAQVQYINENHPGWRWCTAQGARDQVLLIGLETTFREKLEWLEEAETLALRLQGEEDEEGSDKLGAGSTKRDT
jgi:hypothetical protein